VTPVADSLVQTDAEGRALSGLRDASGETDGVMERHCVRCFLLCEKLAARHSADLDREVVLCAAFLHDIGVYDSVTHGGVYTQEGAALAREMALEAGWDERRAGLCADACAYHHSVRSKWELGAEVETMRLADRIEVFAGLFRGGLGREDVREVNAEVPREGFYRGLAGVAWPMLRSRPLTVPQIFKP
jgi:HD superfamily phosphodiesterase